MGLIEQMLGNSPFHPLVEHARKVDRCVKLLEPLLEAAIDEDFQEIQRLHDQVSKLEYEADQVKHQIRDLLSQRFFLPVSRENLDRYLHCQDDIADGVEDFAVTLVIRKTKIHSNLVPLFREYLSQVVQVGDKLIACSEELTALVESSFGGAEAQKILERIATLGEGEWKAQQLQRRVGVRIYEMEEELGTIDIVFYEKMFQALGSVAKSAENTGDMLRAMIVRG